MEEKQEKEENVSEDFVSVFSAVNAMLNKSNNRHLNDLHLNSPKNKLIQSEKNHIRKWRLNRI